MAPAGCSKDFLESQRQPRYASVARVTSIPVVRFSAASPPGHTRRLMFQEIESRLSAAVEQLLASKFNVTMKVTLEQPKQSSFGELAIPVAFQLARQLKRSPRQIAEELVGGLGELPGVAAFEIAGNGYVNVRFHRAAYVSELLVGAKAPAKQSSEKIVVEHTNINPNKAAHIGHLRNAVLGDTLARMLRKHGHRVEVQNYIDNMGV